MNNKRVLIIGSPGSGKSTLARELNQTWNLPLIHLDSKYHDNKQWSADPQLKKAEWREFIKNLCEAESWFMDGNYTSTLDIRIPKADLVIFLNYPRRLALFRVFKRRFLYLKKARPDMPSDWKEKINLDLLKKIWNFETTHKSRITQLLSINYPPEVMTFVSPAATTKYLALQRSKVQS